MPASIAVLSDVHGVLPVVEAVLREPLVASADLVVVTGDHAAGPQPNEVLDRLLALGERVILVRGNADRELVAMAAGTFVGEPPDLISPWAATQLTREHLQRLEALPHPVTIEVDGFGPVVFCHGTPRDDEEVILVDTRPARWAEVFADLPAEVHTVVCGHTHMEFVRLVDRRLVVNSGSIGMPYGRPGGHWALLRDGAVSLHHTPIDVDAVCATIVAGSAYPDVADWVDYFVGGRASDFDALEAFTPRTL